MTRAVLAAATLLLLAPSANALPVYIFTDTKTFAGQATEVIVADCLDPDPDPGPKSGVTTVRVDVVRVLKGERPEGLVNPEVWERLAGAASR